MINNQASKVNQLLKETSEAKEYFALKEAISNNNYLQELLKTIKDTQKEANSLLKENKIKEYNIKKLELKTLKESFINEPLVNNYIVAKSNMSNLLEQIVSILSDN